MPTLKPREFETKDSLGNPYRYRLTKTHLEDLYFDRSSDKWITNHRVSLSKLKATVKASTPGKTLEPWDDEKLNRIGWYFRLSKGGKMVIGCRSFSKEHSDLILRAAGVRVASAKKKAKAKRNR